MCSNWSADYRTDGQYVDVSYFMLNRAHSLRNFKQSGFRTFGQGGGLLVSLRGKASGNNFTIDNCSFIGNRALWGGALHLLLMDSSNTNSITVYKTLFEGNNANNGGGALKIYFKSIQCMDPLSGNLIEFKNCNFTAIMLVKVEE